MTNAGTISGGTDGIDLAGSGNVTNNSGGSISGGTFGVLTTNALATVSNSGRISGSKAVGLEAGGSVTNLAGATISGSSFGVYIAGGSGTATNTGTISGGTDGINLAGSGSITNNSGGSISGGTFGVLTTNALATVSNSGSISGSKAVGLEAGGSVTNAASASISGQIDGVHAQIGAAMLSNAGNISATAGAGVDFEAGGSITNLAGATLSGSTFGVFLTGGSGTVTNAGTISGGTYAIDFAGSGTNRLVIDPGAVFVGKVTGGSGTSTLELASGTGSIGGVGTGSFNNFQVLAVDAGATWTLNGTNIAPTMLNNGTASIAGSLDVSTAIDASSTGLFQLGSGAALEVAADTDAATQVSFQGSSSELIIDNTASFGTNVGTASYAGPQLENFAPSDKIDLKNFSSAGVTFNYNPLTGVLQVWNSANQAASLDFQTSSLASSSFAAASDGATGIFITDSAFGSTSLAEVGNNFYLDSTTSSSGPELQYAGAAVTAGEFGTWTPIGAVQVAGGGYDVAWKNTATGQYTAWSTDSNGNYLSNLIPAVAGNSTALESLETTFNQDLNGDGTIGITKVVIQTDGSTALTEVANNYYLDSTTSSSGPELQYAGAAVTAGEFGTWTPIGAVQVAGGGYDVAWKNTATGQYTAWSTDSNGNYLSNLIPAVAGNSTALESLETTFNQDLNGDGTIGITKVVIQTDGSTALTEVANNYYLDSTTSSSGPELQYAGAAVTAGEFGTWTPIGAVQVTGGGYDVAWHDPGSGLYTVWSVDSNGNYLSNLIPGVSGTSTALESLETTFNQDLNGDGTIGITKVVIQTDGSTALTEVANNYYLDSTTSSSGPELQYAGAAVTAGEFGTWTPIGAVQVAGGGYDVAWKNTATGQYTAWSTDSNGNYLSNLIPAVAGTSTALESLETTFNQDLNGDGTIGITKVVIQTDGSTALTEVGNNFYLDSTTSSSGPELQYAGAAVTAGEFGTWTPIGAVQVAGGGYDVAWKNTATGQYTAWSTDSNGNYLSNLIPAVAGNSTALESLEITFNQELTGGPTLTISNLAPTVSAGGSIPLGVQVTPADADDAVSVTISGLTSYETITDNLDQTIFSGGSVTLSAAEVNSGLTLHSSYGGTGHPVNNLIVTASNTTSGEASSSVAQTIVVTDPPVMASSPPQSSLAAHPTVAMADLPSHVGAPPTGLAPSAYTMLAGLLDQYMAAGSPHNAPGVTSWTAPQQSLLGGDKEFLTRPHG